MIVITIEGGLVQGVSSDDPAEQGKEAVVIDYDAAEGAEPEDVHKVPQGEGDTSDATIDRREVGVLYGPIAEFLKKETRT